MPFKCAAKLNTYLKVLKSNLNITKKINPFRKNFVASFYCRFGLKKNNSSLEISQTFYNM